MVWRVAGISKLRVKKLAGASCQEARPAPPSSPYPGIVGTRPPFSVDSALPALVSRASSGGWPGSGSPGELRVVSLMGGVLRLPWPRTPPAVVLLLPPPGGPGGEAGGEAAGLSSSSPTRASATPPLSRMRARRGDMRAHLGRTHKLPAREKHQERGMHFGPFGLLLCGLMCGFETRAVESRRLSSPRHQHVRDAAERECTRAHAGSLLPPS